MNLVEVAKWIQEGYRKYYYVKRTEDTTISSHDFVLKHVMNCGREKLNPKIISELVDLENSVPDKNGMIQI